MTPTWPPSPARSPVAERLRASLDRDSDQAASVHRNPVNWSRWTESQASITNGRPSPVCGCRSSSIFRRFHGFEVSRFRDSRTTVPTNNPVPEKTRSSSPIPGQHRQGGPESTEARRNCTPIHEKPYSSHQTPVSVAKGANTTQKTVVRTNRATVLMLQIPALSSESGDLTEPGYEQSCH